MLIRFNLYSMLTHISSFLVSRLISIDRSIFASVSISFIMLLSYIEIYEIF